MIDTTQLNQTTSIPSPYTPKQLPEQPNTPLQGAGLNVSWSDTPIYPSGPPPPSESGTGTIQPDIKPPGGGFGTESPPPLDAFGNQIGMTSEQIEARKKYLQQAGGGFDPETGTWLSAQGRAIGGGTGSSAWGYQRPQGQQGSSQTNFGGGVQMPWQWDVAGKTLAGQSYGFPQQTPLPWTQGMAGTQQAMTTGLPTKTPGIWGALAPLATKMATTGAPTSQAPWYQQAKQVAGRDIASSIGQAAEQAGLKGMRWSSPLARQAQEIAARRMGEVGLEWTGRELGAQEVARARQLQAMPLMQQLGMGQAGLSEAARQRQFGALPLQLQFGQAQAGLGESAQQRALQAAGQLAPLGQMAGQFPMDVAQRAMQMGGTMQQQQQQAISPLLQNFLRMTPEASPWLQMAMGATQMPFTQQAQQYQQSPFSQMLGMASMIPFLGGPGAAYG